MLITEARKTHSHDVALDTQITQLQAQIRTAPSKIEYRIHLAQLFMITGQWEKALQQLQTAAQLDAKAIVMAQTYRALIQAEIYREYVFSGRRTVQYFGIAEEWQTLLAESIIARTHQQIASAECLQQKAFEDALAYAFIINDKEVSWIADGDSQLGPVCEVFINGIYYWLAFNQIQQINIEPPQDLRDLVWIPATFTLIDHTQHSGFLPSRYVFSYTHKNDQLSLASATEWTSMSEQCWAGIGQKMLVTDQAEYPLLTIRTLTQMARE